jgi:hypothetical protein
MSGTDEILTNGVEAAYFRSDTIPARAGSRSTDTEQVDIAERAAITPFLRIAQLRTMNQGGQNSTLFHPFSDALALTLDLQASPDLLALPGVAFTAEFQIFDPHIHKIVASTYFGSTFNWGQNFWISKGNNWGPSSDYQTPERWGLSWNVNSLFGFRGLVKAQYIPSSGSGWTAVDAFDVSAVRWFRIRELFRL